MAVALSGVRRGLRSLLTGLSAVDLELLGRARVSPDTVDLHDAVELVDAILAAPQQVDRLTREVIDLVWQSFCIALVRRWPWSPRIKSIRATSPRCGCHRVGWSSSATTNGSRARTIRWLASSKRGRPRGAGRS
jgi:hypothetical protein